VAKRKSAGAGQGVTTALIYTRVSTVEQGEHGVSLAAQLTECRRYAAGQGWVIGGEHRDVMSGRKDARPGYQALLAEMRALRAAGKIVAVVAADFDRLGRRPSEILRLHEETEKLGVEIHAPRKGGKLTHEFIGALTFVAGIESRNTSARVKATREDLIGKGWAPAGREPWGLLWRDSTADERARGAPRRVLDLHPDEAPFVREAFERVAAGTSLSGLLKWMTALPATARGGRLPASVSGVRKTLSAPVYVARHGNAADLEGLSVLDRPAGRWPALIDEETWAAVQRRYASHAHTPLGASDTYLLTGFLRCSTCDARMTGQQHVGPGGTVIRRYRCSGRNRGHACTASASADGLDALAMEAVRALLSPLAVGHPSLRVALERAWEALRPTDESDAHRRKVARLDGIVSTARQRLARANDLFVDGSMPKDQYDESCRRYADEIDAGERELATLVAPKPAHDFPTLDAILRRSGGMIAALDADGVAGRRGVLRELILAIRPRRVGHNRYETDIARTPAGDALATLAGGLASARVVA